MNRLADAWAKLNRAKQHAQELQMKIRTWVEAQRNEPPFELKLHEDKAAGCLVFLVGEVPAIPQEWNLIIGDSLFNFRAALDYLAWQLVQCGTDPRPKKPEDIGWPIYNDEARFWKMVDRRLPGLLPKHRTVVEAYQPYKTTKVHPLGLLNDLSRQDKHRQLVATLAANKEYRIRGRLKSFVLERSVMPQANRPVALKPGTELARLYGKRTSDEKREMDVYFEGTTGIAFENGIWVLEALDRIGSRIGRLLGEFGTLT